MLGWRVGLASLLIGGLLPVAPPAWGGSGSSAPSPVSPAPAVPSPGGAYVWADFDGDGYTDLAIGAPNESLDGTGGAGAVNVVYGTRRGLRAGGNQLWHQGILKAELGTDDQFGSSLAAGDFDGDGYADLAIGAPREDLDGNVEAGAVNVVYGTGRGLRARGNQLWHQGRLAGDLAADDDFGSSLATGDFDGDGYADLAIGAPFEELEGNDFAGAVNVVYGTGRGLTGRGNQLWHQARLTGGLEASDEFGSSLAAADFDADGYADLGIGVPFEDLDANDNAGAVNVVYGTGRGLRARGNQLWHQGRLQGDLEGDDRFGESLAAGDFDGDGHADLAIGAPFEDLDANDNAGAVNVVYGTGRGLRGRGTQLWHQGRLMEDPESGDRFGRGLTAGDFDGDGYADLAVGAPDEDLDGHFNAGSVNVVYGTRRGLRAGGNQLWHQGRLTGDLEANDFFGRALA